MFEPNVSFVFPQWFAGLSVSLLMMEWGFMVGCISPMMTKLSAPDSPIQLDTDQASWFASFINIGRFSGALIGSIATAYLGTKRAIFSTLMPIAFGWLSTALANDVIILYVARLSGGIGLGMALISFPLYLGEIAMPNIRGSLVSFAVFGLPFGQVLGSIGTTYLNIKESAFIYLGICIFLMVIFFFLPESPHHLMKVGNQKAAKKAIRWYRSGIDVDKEFDAVQKFVASENSITFMDRLQEFKNLGTRRATYQVMILFAFMQSNGLNSIVFYLEMVLKKAQFNLISPSEMVIHVNVCAVVATILSTFLIDRFGRKFLLLLSSTGVIISLVMMASHFYLIDMNFNVTNLQWLPAVSIILYMFFFFIGLGPVPSTIMSEIIPAKVKCIVACIGSFTAGIFSFVSTRSYQPMVDLIGESYTLLFYVFITILIIPYTLFVMRETKGKSLQQIHEDFIKK